MNARTPRPMQTEKRDRTLKSEQVSSKIEEIPSAVNDSDVVSDRHDRIALAAYYRAHGRGFEPGYELDDWLAAEREIDAAGSRNNIALD